MSGRAFDRAGSQTDRAEDEIRRARESFGCRQVDHQQPEVENGTEGKDTAAPRNSQQQWEDTAVLARTVFFYQSMRQVRMKSLYDSVPRRLDKEHARNM